jgi:hypothetical protein
MSPTIVANNRVQVGAIMHNRADRVNPFFPWGNCGSVEVDFYFQLIFVDAFLSMQ